MMRFLRGTFFRIGGSGYNDFEDIQIQEAPPPVDLAQRAALTAGMNFGATAMFTRAYVPPPPRALFLPSDDFTRLPNPPGNGPLAGLWDFPLQSPAPNRPQVINNQVREGTENVDNCAFYGPTVAWEIDEFVPDQIVGQFSQIILQDPLPHGTAGNYVGVVLRCDKAAGSGVVARFYLGGVFWNGTTLDCRLYYWNGSAFVAIGAPNAVLPWAIGDVLRCEITGDETPGNACFITLFKNSTTIMRFHLFGNAFKTKGTGFGGAGIAIKGNDGSFWLDQWSAGELRPVADHLFHRENWNSQADGAMGQPWSFAFPIPNRPRINNHQVVTASTVNNQGATAYYSEAGFNVSNQYSQARIVTLPTTGTQRVGVTVRTGGGVNSHYLALIHGANDYRIWLFDSVSFNYIQKAAGTAFTIAAGGILRAEITGNSPVVMNMYYNGTLILTYTFVDENTEIRVGGFPGLAIFDPVGLAMKLDDWEGGRL